MAGRTHCSLSGLPPSRVVQETTRPDPFEREVMKAPHVRTIHVEPVGPYAQTCNILYPRRLLERLVGSTSGLSPARTSGSRSAPAPPAPRSSPPSDAIVYHAIESHTPRESSGRTSSGDTSPTWSRIPPVSARADPGRVLEPGPSLGHAGRPRGSSQPVAAPLCSCSPLPHAVRQLRRRGHRPRRRADRRGRAARRYGSPARGGSRTCGRQRPLSDSAALTEPPEHQLLIALLLHDVALPTKVRRRCKQWLPGSRRPANDHTWSAGAVCCPTGCFASAGSRSRSRRPARRPQRS